MYEVVVVDSCAVSGVAGDNKQQQITLGSTTSTKQQTYKEQTA